MKVPNGFNTFVEGLKTIGLESEWVGNESVKQVLEDNENDWNTTDDSEDSDDSKEEEVEEENKEDEESLKVTRSRVVRSRMRKTLTVT